MAIIKFFRPAPPLHLQYASREEMDRIDRKLLATETRLETEIRNLGDRIGEMYEKIERSDEARTSGLHKRMNSLADSVNQLIGAMESNQDLIRTVVKELCDVKKGEPK